MMNKIQKRLQHDWIAIVIKRHGRFPSGALSTFGVLTPVLLYHRTVLELPLILPQYRLSPQSLAP